jgi:hypothetical protein
VSPAASDLPASTGNGWRRAQHVLTLGMAWIFLWGFFAIGEGSVEPGLLALVVIGAGAATWAAAVLLPDAEPIDWTPAYVSTVPTARDPRFSRLARMLGEATDRVTVSDEIHRTLRSLTTQRLAEHHRVDLAADPELAQSILGEELYRYVTRPARRLRGNEAARLSELLSRIEAL